LPRGLSRDDSREHAAFVGPDDADRRIIDGRGLVCPACRKTGMAELSQTRDRISLRLLRRPIGHYDPSTGRPVFGPPTRFSLSVSVLRSWPGLHPMTRGLVCARLHMASKHGRQISFPLRLRGNLDRFPVFFVAGFRDADFDPVRCGPVAARMCHCATDSAIAHHITEQSVMRRFPPDVAARAALMKSVNV
jgi:hypothetical protein